MIYPVIKRVFDFSLASMSFIILSLFFLLIALAIKLDSEGPVFYRGVRVGRGGKPFKIYKFRTMIVRADKIGGSSTPKDDPRITRVGKFLRRYKLDEMPQLMNIILGEMSFVGPRPQVQWAVDLYTDEERQVLSVRPGLTDLASLRFSNEGEILKGSLDPDKDYMEKIHPLKMQLSLQYVRERSFLLDLQIMVRTVMAVARS